MTISELARARVLRNGMTEAQATAFLAQLTRSTAWQDVGWLSTRSADWDEALIDRIDFAAGRWMTNPSNAPKPEPISVRQYRNIWPSGARDGKALASGEDEGPEAARSASGWPGWCRR